MARIASILFAVLLVTSGCQALGGRTSTPLSPTPTESSQTEMTTGQVDETRLGWSLQILTDKLSTEEGGVVDGYVAIGGHFDGRVYGVAVQFLNEDKELVKEVPIGNITRIGDRRAFNTTIPTIPVYVIAKADGWETPGTEFTGSDGFEITEDGRIGFYGIYGSENFTR